MVGGNGLPAMAASPQAQDLRLLRRVSRLFLDGPRCLRLNWGPAALSSIAVRIGLAIRLARSWIPASPWMIVARANRRRRTQNHFAAPEHPHRSQFTFAVSDLFDQVGNPENRRQRQRDHDPDAEPIPLKSIKRHRHLLSPLGRKQQQRPCRGKVPTMVEPAAAEPTSAFNVVLRKPPPLSANRC